MDCRQCYGARWRDARNDCGVDFDERGGQKAVDHQNQWQVKILKWGVKSVLLVCGKYMLEQHIHLRAESPATGQRHSRPPSQVSLTRFCSTANTNLGQSPFQREMLKFSKRNAETAVIFYFLQYSSNMSSGGPPAVSQAKARRYDRQLRCVDSLLRIELHHITLVFRLLIPNHRVFKSWHLLHTPPLSYK